MFKDTFLFFILVSYLFFVQIIINIFVSISTYSVFRRHIVRGRYILLSASNLLYREFEAQALIVDLDDPVPSVLQRDASHL